MPHTPIFNRPYVILDLYMKLLSVPTTPEYPCLRPRSLHSQTYGIPPHSAIVRYQLKENHLTSISI